jgi:Uma2 family endonuclease
MPVMRKSKPTVPAFDVFSELWDSLGRVPPERIRMQPPPGTATEEDCIAAESRYNRLCELIDGTLVEKVMGWYESRVALVLGRLLDEYAERHDLGFTFGEAGMIRTDKTRVRMPDLSFVLWSRFPGRVLPKGQILNLVPDLAVEVLSPKNTRAEMERKRREYFLGGCRLVWEIDPDKKTARVYTAPDESKRISEKGKLTGGDLLPGFELPLAELFARAGRRPE